MAGQNSKRRFSRVAPLISTVVALGGLTLVGCSGSSSKQQPQKIEDIVFLEGVPSMPHVSFNTYNSLSFVLNLPSGEEILCTCQSSDYRKAGDLNRVSAAIIDAHEDNEKIRVGGTKPLDSYSNEMEIYDIHIRGFGTFFLRDLPK